MRVRAFGGQMLIWRPDVDWYPVCFSIAFQVILEIGSFTEPGTYQSNQAGWPANPEDRILQSLSPVLGLQPCITHRLQFYMGAGY